jgi:hypothetical protein
MKLCTFEVSTHLGRYSRVGICRDSRIIDVNFANAWHLAQQGESEPHKLADALTPSSMMDFLRAGLRAMHAAEELFLDTGPQPAQWWNLPSPPRGPNDETLSYRPDEVRMRAPVPNPARLGSSEDVQCGEHPECEIKLAAVIGKQGRNVPAIDSRQYIAGFTVMIDFGASCAAVGPCLVTVDEIVSPYELNITARINGKPHSRAHTGDLRPKFEQTIELLSTYDVILPGDMISFLIDLSPPIKRGDVIELDAEKIGTLRTKLV